MDPITFLPFPLVADHELDRDLVEIDAAIALVARGLARRVLPGQPVLDPRTSRRWAWPTPRPLASRSAWIAPRTARSP